jgi:MFS family permease
VLTQAINWHWIFFVNVPIGIATAIWSRRLVERDEGIGLSAGADVPGAVLITSALMLGVYTIVKPAADDGWLAGQTLLLGAISLALMAGFIAREATARTPLMPLRIFRSRNVTGANLVQVLSVAGMFGVFFLGTLYLQRVLGYDALEIGLASLPVTILMGTLSVRYSERLITRVGARACLFPGMGMIAAALAYYSRAPVDGSYVVDVLPVMVLIGLGAGTCFPALMSLAMSGVVPTEAGLASGLVNTSAQAGGALGLAILATLSASRTDHLLAGGSSQIEAMTGGYHLAFLVAAGLVVACMIVGFLVIEPPEKAAAHAVPESELGPGGEVATEAA